MEEIRTFNGGLNKDASPLQQPKDTYREAVNFVQLSKEGNIYALTNESGAVEQTTTFPSGFQVMGHTVLDNEIFVALAHISGYSQIGYIDRNGKYTRSVPSINENDALADTNSELQLTTDRPVKMVARKRLGGERLIYFCDGVGGRPLGFVNADAPAPIGSILDGTKVIPNQSVPQIDLDEIKETAGNLQVGMYHFVTRYYTKDLTPTTFGIPSGGIPIVDNYRSEGRKKFDGEYPDHGKVNKAISLNLSNIDTAYPFLEIVVIKYDGITNTLVSEALPLVNITDSRLTFTYSGDEGDVTSLTQEEINTIPISYSAAKCVIQKDNVLFWSNLADNSNKFDAALQRFANDITIRYQVKEIEYRPSGDEDIVSADFSLVGNPYISLADTPSQNIVLKFNQDVSISSSNVLSNFTFYDAGSESSGIVSITDATLWHDGTTGDTIVIDNGAGTVETYTAVQGTAAAFEFDVQSQDAVTIATNLVNAINANSVIATAGNGVNSNQLDVGIVSTVVGTAANNYTIAYNDLSTTGIGATLFERDGITTGNPVSMTDGVNPAAYTPDAFLLPDPNDLSTIVLFFDPSLKFGGTGIPGGGTLDYVVTASSGTTITGIGVDVIVTASTSDFTSNAAGEFNDYKSEDFTFYNKTYMRNEVYSFGIFVTFKDGASSFNYHIPGNDKVTLNTTSAIADTPGSYTGETGGLLGTYVSTNNDYPTKQAYPGTSSSDDISCFSAPQNNFVSPSDRQVRHHKMPSLLQEPHFRYDETTEKTFIRLLNLNFTFNSALPSELINQIQSITITREKRDTQEKKSIFAQGLVDRYVNYFTDYPYKWEPGNIGNNEKGPKDPVWKRMPFFNSSKIININVKPNNESLVTIGAGQTFPSISYELKQNGLPTGEAQGSADEMFAANQRMAFFSPDSQLGDLSPNTIEGTFLTPVLGMKANLSLRHFKISRNKEDSIKVGGGLWGGTSNVVLSKFILFWMFGNFFKEDTSINVGTPSRVEGAQYIPKGGEVFVPGLIDRIDNQFGSRHLYLKTSNVPAFGTTGRIEITFKAVMVGNANGFFPNTKEHENKDSYQLTGDVTNNLFNLEAENLGQYGSPGGAEYIPIATVRTLPTSQGQVLYAVYGGDTFITKFSYRNCDIFQYKGLQSSNSTTGAIGVTENGYTSQEAGQHDNSPFRGMNFKAIGYYFVESTINTFYRHQYINRADPNNPQLEATYVPNVPPRVALQDFQNVGDSRGYNLQYSFENDIRTFSNKLAAQSTVGLFTNRTIHSNKALEDELVDSYRLYQQNSFYDMPKNTGPIWDTFVYNNSLYLHTTKSLWKAFVNDVTQQATSVGQVVLGTGGLFTLPAKEVIVSTGGYAGTISQFGGVLTPYGYFFPDVLQGKMFMLQGEQLREISQKGLQQYFFSALDPELILNNGYVDNPFTGKGMVGGYDFEKKRVIFTKVGTENDFSISFSTLSNTWISEHTYQPNVFYSLDNKFYAVVNDLLSTSRVFRHNVGDYGVFYDGFPASSKLTVIFNEAAGINKVWDNMKLHTVSRDNVGVIQQFNTWSNMQFYTDTRNTGWVELFPTNAYGSKAVDDPTNQVRVRRNNNKFNLTVPSDVVVDETVSKFDLANQDRSRLFKPRIKGDHATVDFIYNNSNNYEFIVNFISTTFRLNAL